jgi:hypothetical protein
MFSVYFLVMLVVDVVFSVLALIVSGDVNRKKKRLGGEYSVKGLKKFYGLSDDYVDRDVLLDEYHRTQEMLVHYDNLNWLIGLVLVSSNIIALGFVSFADNRNVVFAAAFGGSFALFCWVLWFYRHVSIYNVKNDRLYMIEQELGMAQHRMVGYASKNGLLVRIPGRNVALLLFFGLLIAWLIALL